MRYYEICHIEHPQNKVHKKMYKSATLGIYAHTYCFDNSFCTMVNDHIIIKFIHINVSCVHTILFFFFFITLLLHYTVFN